MNELPKCSAVVDNNLPNSHGKHLQVVEAFAVHPPAQGQGIAGLQLTERPKDHLLECMLHARRRTASVVWALNAYTSNTLHGVSEIANGNAVSRHCKLSSSL